MTSESVPPQRLERCGLFHGLTTEELDAVFSRVRNESFRAGQNILDEGRVYHALWVIVTGRCEVVKCGNGKAGSRLAELDTGHVFGEMSFFGDFSHSADVRALTDVQTMRLVRDSFEDLRTTHPHAAHKIIVNVVSVISERLRRMDDWIFDLVQQDGVQQHYAEWQDFRKKLYSDWQF